MTTSLRWQWRFLWWWPIAGFLAVLSLFALFNIDHGLQDWLYDPTHGFPFQHSQSYELWLHDRIKIASNSLLWVLLATVFWPTKNYDWRHVRGPLFIAFLAITGSVSAMQSLKDVTGIYCPVQLQEYGGAVELHPKLQVGHLILLNEGAGRCWPAGHATAGFAWIALFFAFHQMGRKRAAFTALIAALVYGHFLGLTQVVRGQHFLSHQFYTMAVCWLVNLTLFSGWHLWWQYRRVFL